MTAPAARTAADDEADAAAARKALRTAKLPLERAGGFGVEAGTSEVPAKPSRIEKAIEGLAKPIAAGAEVRLSHEQLEEQRLYVLEEARKVAEQKRELDRSLREYQSAHGLSPTSNLPSKIGLVRN